MPVWYSSAVVAFFALSLVANALLTGLIVYKIIGIYRDIQGFSGETHTDCDGRGPRDLYPLISILAESGMITFVAQLLQTSMYKTTFDGFRIVNGSVVMLYVRVSIVKFSAFIMFIYFTGNFDSHCPCACRDGRFLRSSYIYIRDSEFVTPHTLCTLRIEQQQSDQHRRSDHHQHYGRRSRGLVFRFRDETHAKCMSIDTTYMVQQSKKKQRFVISFNLTGVA